MNGYIWALILYTIGAMESFIICRYLVGRSGFWVVLRALIWPLYTVKLFIEAVWDELG